MPKLTQNDRIREALAMLGTNGTAHNLDGARAILNQLIAPVASKPKSLEALTIDLGKGIRRFNPEDPKAVKMSESEGCVICHVTLKFARIAPWIHLVALGKYAASYAHLGCVTKAEIERDRIWTELDAKRGAVGFDKDKASICLCGHGFLAHRKDSLENYLECESREYSGSAANRTVEAVNHGLEKRGDDKAVMMFHENGSRIARSITSDRYDRIWNSEITPYLLDLRSRGWVTPPAYSVKDTRSRAATIQDVGEYTIVREGQMISPSGVYASDHDMFVFMIDPSRNIADGSDGGLFRGFFCWNSEVGASSFGIMTFLFRYVCGNHIVWSASGVSKVRIRHVGSASARFGREMMGTLTRYRDESAAADEAGIASAIKFKLGDDKEAVLAKLFGMRSLGVSQSVLVNAYDSANQEVDGDVRTAYGFANALTRYSQRIPYADERAAVDRAAGKVVASAF